MNRKLNNNNRNKKTMKTMMKPIKTSNMKNKINNNLILKNKVRNKNKTTKNQIIEHSLSLSLYY